MKTSTKIGLEDTQNISQIRRPALRKLFPEGPFVDGRSSDEQVNGPLHEQEEVR